METIREGDDLLLSLRAAYRRLNLSKRQFLRIAEKEGFKRTYRDMHGKRALPPREGAPAIKGEGAFEYYRLSELEEYHNDRNALKFTVTVERDKAYPIAETSRLTGIPICRLRSTKEAKALGLERVRVRLRSTCKRKKGKRVKEAWTRTRLKVGFTKKSVDAYLEANPKLTELCVPADEIKTEAAAETLGIDGVTVVKWWHAGLLAGTMRKYWTDAGIREGLCLKNDSVRDAKPILDRVGGRVSAARRLILASQNDLFWVEHKTWLTALEIKAQHHVSTGSLECLRRHAWPELPTGKIRVVHIGPTGQPSASGLCIFHPKDVAHALAAPDGRTKEARALKARSSPAASPMPTAGTPDTSQPREPTTIPAVRSKGGRKRSESTEKLYKLCYEMREEGAGYDQIKVAARKLSQELALAQRTPRARSSNRPAVPTDHWRGTPAAATPNSPPRASAGLMRCISHDKIQVPNRFPKTVFEIWELAALPPNSKSAGGPAGRSLAAAARRAARRADTCDVPPLTVAFILRWANLLADGAMAAGQSEPSRPGAN